MTTSTNYTGTMYVTTGTYTVTWAATSTEVTWTIPVSMWFTGAVNAVAPKPAVPKIHPELMARLGRDPQFEALSRRDDEALARLSRDDALDELLGR